MFSYHFKPENAISVGLNFSGSKWKQKYLSLSPIRLKKGFFSKKYGIFFNLRS